MMYSNYYVIIVSISVIIAVNVREAFNFDNDETESFFCLI